MFLFLLFLTLFSVFVANPKNYYQGTININTLGSTVQHSLVAITPAHGLLNKEKRTEIYYYRV